MRIAALVARYLLGIMFVVFGLNGFLHFLPQTMPASPLAVQYFTVMISSQIILFVFAIQLICGILFLINRYVPLALTLIAPVIVNILLFHITMNLAGIVPGLIATILWFLVFFSRRSAFDGILKSDAV